MISCNCLQEEGKNDCQSHNGINQQILLLAKSSFAGISNKRFSLGMLLPFRRVFLFSNDFNPLHAPVCLEGA